MTHSKSYPVPMTWKQAVEWLPNLAKDVDMKYALLTKRDKMNWRTQAVGFWMENHFGPLFEYDLTGAPCETIFQGESRCFCSNIQQRFPEDKDLFKLNLESYAGAPIVNCNGIPIGHVCVFDEKPIVNSDVILRVLDDYAKNIHLGD